VQDAANSVVKAPGKAQPAGLRPLSLGQQRLWFIDQLYPNSCAYNLPFKMRLEGRINHSALQSAFTNLVQRHEILRTVLVPKAGLPVGFLLPARFLDFKYFDLRNCPAEERESKATGVIDEQSRRPFNMARGPLFRVVLIQLGDNSHVLLHTVPHLAFDAGSIPIMYREVEKLYATACGNETPVPELPFQYSDYATWQRQQQTGDEHEKLMQYWIQKLEGSAPREMPSDRPRPSLKTLQGGRYHWALAPDLVQSATEFFNLHRISAFRGLCAGLMVFLHCYTGGDDLLISSPVATRPPGSEHLIGLFVNTVVFRIQLTDNPNFHEILARVSRTVKEGVVHAALEFDRIIAALNPPRDATRTPLVQLNFRVRKTPYPSLQFPGVNATRAEYVDTGTSKFDLALEFEASEGTSYFEYSTDLFADSTIVRMAEDYQLVLRALVDRPDVPVKQLPEIQELRRARSGV
jgi:condensation domain-containing protein